MKNIVVDATPSLGMAIRSRRLELGWSQAKLAGRLQVQRQWVIRLEAGSHGAEVGTVMRAMRALNLTVTTRLAVRDPLPVIRYTGKARGKKRRSRGSKAPPSRHDN